MEPYSTKKVMGGESVLCNDSYCIGYGNSMRMKSNPYLNPLYAGFSKVLDVKF